MAKKKEGDNKKCKTSIEGALFCQHYSSSSHSLGTEIRDSKLNVFLGSLQGHVWKSTAHAMQILIFSVF